MIDVACQIRFTTTIVLPFEERILDFVTGAANIACVKPSLEDTRTNVTLVTEAGRIFFFRVSEGDSEPDIHVYVDAPDPEADPAAELPPPHQPKFISRDQVADYEAATQAATERAREAWVQAEQRVQSAVDEFRAGYPTLMRFEYRLSRRALDAPCHIAAMWHDGRFTYARSLAVETPALYEERDGQPSLVSYELTPDGLYIVRRVLSDGWFQLGKRRAEWTRLVARQPPVGPPPEPEPIPAEAARAASP